METTQLLDENWCKRWGFLQIRELGGILEQGNYSLQDRESNMLVNSLDSLWNNQPD